MFEIVTGADLLEFVMIVKLKYRCVCSLEPTPI